MKRVILAITGTVAGLAALLSFKSGSPLPTPPGGLPAAGLPTSDAASAGAGGSTTAPATTGSSSNTGSSSSSAPSHATSADYTGTAVDTQYGTVQVKVTVAGGKITNVAFVQLTAFDDRSQQINSEAAPILLQETLSAQSAKIDSVSGASYTSAGYEQSLQSALDEAGLP